MLAGASEKRRRADMLRHNPNADWIESRKGKNDSLNSTAAVLIFLMCLGLAALLSMEEWVTTLKKISAKMPWDVVKAWLFSSKPPSLTGNQDVDFGIVLFVRACTLYLLAGIVPFFARVLANIHPKPTHETVSLFFLWMMSTFACAFLLTIVALI